MYLNTYTCPSLQRCQSFSVTSNKRRNLRGRNVRKWHFKHTRECLKVMMTWRYTVYLVNSKVIRGKENITLRLEWWWDGRMPSWGIVKWLEIGQVWKDITGTCVKGFMLRNDFILTQFWQVFMAATILGWPVQCIARIQKKYKNSCYWSWKQGTYSTNISQRIIKTSRLLNIGVGGVLAMGSIWGVCLDYIINGDSVNWNRK